MSAANWGFWGGGGVLIFFFRGRNVHQVLELIMHFIADTDTDENDVGINFS